VCAFYLLSFFCLLAGRAEGKIEKFFVMAERFLQDFWLTSDARGRDSHPLKNATMYPAAAAHHHRNIRASSRTRERERAEMKK
jgi:hypothetical protein